MGLRRQALAGTTDGSGVATLRSPYPINGYVREIRFNAGGTATYTFTRDAAEGGGTVATLTAKVGPFSHYPRADAISTSGTATALVPIPVDGNLTCAIASGPASTAMTVHVYHDCEY